MKDSSACCISSAKSGRSDRGAHVDVGMMFAQWVVRLPTKQYARVRIPHILPRKRATQRRASVRTENGLRPKPHLSGCWQFGGPQGRKPRGPWRSAARLGSPRLELARLTVGNAPTRFARRVQCRTLKKAVMGVYRRAAWADGGGHPGNGVGHGARYTRQRTLDGRRSLNRLQFGWARISWAQLAQQHFFGAIQGGG